MVRYPRLYKYLSPRRIDIVNDGLVRFTQPAAMNDPFDVKPFVAIGSDEYIRRKITEEEYRKESENANKGKRDEDVLMQLPEEDLEARIEYKTRAWKEYGKQMQMNLMRRISDKFGLFCLTEDSTSIPMWSHYADNHRGFVLEFDPEHEFFHSKGKSNFERVKYSTERPGFTPDSDIDFDPMFTKSSEWAYEKEWRLVGKLSEADEKKPASPFDKYMFKVPYSAMKSLILGCNMTDEDRDELIKAVRQNGKLEKLNILVAEQHSQKYRLVLRDIGDVDFFERAQWHFL